MYQSGFNYRNKTTRNVDYLENRGFIIGQGRQLGKEGGHEVRERKEEQEPVKNELTSMSASRHHQAPISVI